MKYFRSFLFSLAFVLFCAFAANAQDATTEPIDDLKEDAAKIGDIYDDVVPVAVGSTVFSMGALLVKRIAFS